MNQLRFSPRILADAACHLCKPNQQQHALEEFGGYHRGGPRVASQTPYVLRDKQQLHAMIYPKHPYDTHELRRSQERPEAQPPE